MREPLAKEYRNSNKGAKIRHPPANYPWAYEMQVEDPDGNVLRFGSEPIADQPFSEWLDIVRPRVAAAAAPHVHSPAPNFCPPHSPRAINHLQPTPSPVTPWSFTRVC